MMATTVKEEIQFVMPALLVTIVPQAMMPYHAQWDIILCMEYRIVLCALKGGHALWPFYSQLLVSLDNTLMGKLEC